MHTKLVLIAISSFWSPNYAICTNISIFTLYDYSKYTYHLSRSYKNINCLGQQTAKKSTLSKTMLLQCLVYPHNYELSKTTSHGQLAKRYTDWCEYKCLNKEFVNRNFNTYSAKHYCSWTLNYKLLIIQSSGNN